MVDVELYVSKKRYDVNWTNLDRDNLGGGTWKGKAAKDHDLLKVHVVDGGHISSLNRQNDGIDVDIARLALI
jgi:hypothetical protein